MRRVAADQGDIADAAGEVDFYGLQDACVRLGNHAVQVRATLPTPVPALTREMTLYLDALDQAATACVLGVANYNGNQLTASAAFANEASGHLNEAQAILERYTN